MKHKDIDIVNEEEKNNSIKIHKFEVNKNKENIGGEEKIESKENKENKEKDIKKEIDNNNINNATDRDKNKDNEKKRIIKKVKVNKPCTYLCFLCVRKRKNVQNVLLDEGMKVITEKLDIMNLFKKLYIDEIIQEKVKIKDVKIEMSEECKENLQKYI